MNQNPHSGLNKLFILIAVIATIIFIGNQIKDSSNKKSTVVRLHQISEFDSAYKKRNKQQIETEKEYKSIPRVPPRNKSQGTSNVDKEWYQGGTLHKSMAFQWKQAEYRNKLATAADWVSGSMRQKGYTPKSMDEIKKKAKELLICVEEAIDEPKIMDIRMVEVAVVCMILMGW